MRGGLAKQPLASRPAVGGAHGRFRPIRGGAHWLSKPNEIRTLPERQALVLADVAAPLLVGIKPYFLIRSLTQQANLPFRQQPEAGKAQPPMKRLPPPTHLSETGGLSPD